MKTETTYAKAYAACETFFLETGQVPTIEAIKPIVGVNSPSIISSAIKSWKSDLSQTVRHQQGIDPGVPKPLLDAVTALWGQALAEAKESIKDKMAGLDAKEAALGRLSEELKKEAERIGQLVNVTEEKYKEEAAYLKKENDRLTTEATTAWSQLESYRTAASAVEMKNAVLTEEIRQEKDKYGRLESQYDREHDWSLKRIAEEKENHRRETAQEMKRLQSESTRNKQAADMAQAKLDQLSQQAHDYRNLANQLEGNVAQERLKVAELTLDKANLQNELNQKDEKIRLLLVKKTKTITRNNS